MRARIHCLLLATLAAGLTPTTLSPQGSSRWGADYFPNIELTTHEGKVVRFFDDLIKDRVVAINFIYTNCPDACPLETARLVEVQRILGERVGKDVFMYSISIDPERDTVEALADYAERFQAGPGWLFLRGDEQEVDNLRRKLGVLARDETDLEDHSLSLVIGNQATGRWMRRSPFDNAHVLADEIGSWLHNWKQGPRVGADYSEAPELRRLSKGESLFRTRCSACHTIGAGDGIVRVGPNLLGVTDVRERAWLERWLAEPDVMLAEGDPLAVSLFEAYRRVPMPNMRLNEIEIAAVLEYVEDESAFLSPAPSAPASLEFDEPELPAAASGGCCMEKEIPAQLADGDAADGEAQEQETVLSTEPVLAGSDETRPRGGGAALATMTVLLIAGGAATILRHRLSSR